MDAIGFIYLTGLMLGVLLGVVVTHLVTDFARHMREGTE